MGKRFGVVFAMWGAVGAAKGRLQRSACWLSWRARACRAAPPPPVRAAERCCCSCWRRSAEPSPLVEQLVDSATRCSNKHLTARRLRATKRALPAASAPISTMCAFSRAVSARTKQVRTEQSGWWHRSLYALVCPFRISQLCVPSPTAIQPTRLYHSLQLILKTTSNLRISSHYDCI